MLNPLPDVTALDDDVAKSDAHGKNWVIDAGDDGAIANPNRVWVQGSRSQIVAAPAPAYAESLEREDPIDYERAVDVLAAAEQVEDDPDVQYTSPLLADE